MRARKPRLIRYALLLFGGTMLFQGAGAACGRMIGDEALTATNFCFIFDCQNGILGGMIDPCVPGQELFIDCFNNQGP